MTLNFSGNLSGRQHCKCERMLKINPTDTIAPVNRITVITYFIVILLSLIISSCSSKVYDFIVFRQEIISTQVNNADTLHLDIYGFSLIFDYDNREPFVHQYKDEHLKVRFNEHLNINGILATPSPGAWYALYGKFVLSKNKRFNGWLAPSIPFYLLGPIGLFIAQVITRRTSFTQTSFTLTVVFPASHRLL